MNLRMDRIMDLSQIKSLLDSNQNLVVVLDKSYYLDEPITIPFQYTHDLTIIGNGFSIESKDGPSFIVEGGVLRVYGCKLNSPVVINNCINDKPHAFIGVDFSEIKEDVPAIVVDNTDLVAPEGYECSPMRVLVTASVAPKKLESAPFVSFKDNSEGTLWVVGCDLGHSSKMVAEGVGPRSSLVSVSNILGSSKDFLGSEVRDKISFNNYYYDNSSRSKVLSEYGGFLHNEPWVVDRRDRIDVSAIPTVVMPPVFGASGIELSCEGSTKVRYVAHRDIDSPPPPSDYITVWDQCSLKDYTYMSEGDTAINCYVDNYHECPQDYVLFTNPFDSAERLHRIRFDDRKPGTY